VLSSFSRLFRMLAVGALSALASAAFAQQDTPPDVLVKNVTLEVIDIIAKDKEIQAGNQRKVVDSSRQRCCRTSTSHR
jgi:hypothetical protein